MNRVFSLHATRSVLAFAVSLCAGAGALAQSAEQNVPAPESYQAAQARVQALKATSAYGIALQPQALGNSTIDLVYTPVTPCRIVDTRIAGGGLVANVTKTFDVDGLSSSGTSYAEQGGFNGSCGIPYGQVYSVAMTITSVGPAGGGNFVAWGLGTKPTSSALNFSAGQIVANTTIVPVVPGVGNDFSMSSNVNSNVVIDVVGYFAAPVATALDCTTVTSGITTVAYNVWTPVDAFCSYPYTVTGGGFLHNEGTLGQPGIWTDGSPTASNGNGWRTWVDNQTGSNRTVNTYARCCRIPGR